MYETMGMWLLYLGIGAWPLIQAWVWWPTIKSFCNDEKELAYKYTAGEHDTDSWGVPISDFRLTMAVSWWILTIIYVITLLILPYIWPVIIAIGVAGGTMYAFRMNARIKRMIAEIEKAKPSSGEPTSK